MSKISEFLNDIPPIRRFKAEKQLSRMGYRADDVDDFLQCIRKNRPDAVGLFLKAEKIKFDEKNTGDLALLYASEYGFTEIVSLLLGLEVIDINAQNEDGNTALLCASRNGYTEIASLLLKKKKININAQTPGLLDTPLIIAARQGNIELVRLLLEYPNINVNQENKLGISALYEAIRLGYRDIEDLLVTKDADRVSASQNILKREKGIEFTETAFLEAVNHFDQPIVDLFLDGEITPDARDDERNTPLILASRMGWLSLVERLLDSDAKKKADKDARNKFEVSAIMTAVYERHTEIEARLRQEKVDERGVAEARLMMAIEKGDVEAVKAELQKLPSLSYRNPTGKTPLGLAVSLMDAGSAREITTVLLDAKAPVNAKDGEGKTALMYAAEQDRCEIMKLLIEKDRSSVNEVSDGKKKTALMFAAERGNASAVACLKSYGADPDLKDIGNKSARTLARLAGYDHIVRLLPYNRNDDAWDAMLRAASLDDVKGFESAMAILQTAEITDPSENTPLMLAAMRGSSKIIELLFDYNVEVNKKNIDGDTALILAARAGQLEVLNKLLERAELEIKNKNGDTALIEAAAHGDLQVVQALLGANADVDAENDRKGTVLTEACRRGDLETVQALIDWKKKSGASKEVLLEFLNHEIPYGYTSLMISILAGNTQITSFLTELLTVLVGDRSKKGELEAGLFLAARNGDKEHILNLISRAEGENAPLKINARNTAGYSALMEATQSGHREVIDILLEKGADPLISLHGSISALSLAAMADRLDIIELLIPKIKELEANKSEKQRGSQATAALGIASRKGNTQIVDYLLNNSAAKIDGSLSRGVPLIGAAANGYIEIVRSLLDKEANVNQMDSEKQTALYYAILNGYRDIARLLIANGADQSGVDSASLIAAARDNDLPMLERLLDKGNNVLVNCYDREGRSPLMWAVMKKRKKVVALLLSKNADIDLKTKNGRTALMEACKKGRADIVKLLLATLDKKDKLKCSAVVDAADVDNKEGEKVKEEKKYSPMTPLKEALLGGHKEIVKLLEEYGAVRGKDDAELLEAADKGNKGELERLIQTMRNVDVRDHSKRTPLMLAVRSGWQAGARILRDAGADLDLVDKNGDTVLILAVRKRFKNLVEFLLEANASQEIGNRLGITALVEASQLGYDDIVSLLVKKKEALNLRTESGETALIAAIQNRKKGVVDILLSEGVDLNVKTRSGYTALMEAAQLGEAEIVQSLVDKKVDYRLCDESGTTALMLAVVKGLPEIVEILSRLGADFLNAADAKGRTALTFAHLSGNLAGVSEASLPSLGQELPKNLVKGMDEIERNLLRQGAREGWNEAELVLAARANEWEYIEKIIVDGVRIDIQDSQGRTAVHFAAANGAQDSLEALLGENAAVDERDHNGRTPLMEAARGGHLDVVKYLLTKQINIGNRDSHKDTALIEAAREGFVQILEALFEKSPNLLAWNEDFHTALMEASAAGRLDAINSLVGFAKMQADGLEKMINFVDLKKRTALDLARNGGHTECAKVLEANGGMSGAKVGLMVCTTKQGRCFHKIDCPAIRKADAAAELNYPLTIAEAHANNYDSCSRCKPELISIIQKVKILYLGAQPLDQANLRLGRERDEIQNIVQMAEYRDYLSLDERMSAQPKDISQALHQAKPTVVHFAGHGEDGTLCLETADGMTYPVEADALAAMLEEFADSIDCVVLNACDTGYLAETIAEHIDYVIGMSETISDEAAIAFSVGFYKALGAGRAIPEAHRLGCAEIGIYGIPESLKPRLVKRQSILEGV